MKKLVRIGLAAIISLGTLSGWSLLGKENGIIAYGSEQQVNTVIH